MNREKVTLSVGGTDFSGWKSVSIRAGLERQAREFNLGITWQWPGGGPVPVRIEQGEEVQIRIGADLLLTGYAFGAPIWYDNNKVNLSIIGRSRTADLVDCAAANSPGQWRNRTVKAIITELAGEYQIPVLGEQLGEKIIADHTILPGETAFESIDRLLTISRLFSTDDGLGRLVIARPGSAGRATDNLELGKNILSGQANLDFSNVFSEYVCKGQRSGTDESFGSAASEVEARICDKRIARRRVKIIRESGQTTEDLAGARAQWERANAVGKALAVEYTLQGWRQSSGELWRHNLLARLIDPLIGFDRDVLISEISYELSESSGTTAKISVAPPEAFLPEPNDSYERRKLKKGKATDNFEYLIPAEYNP